MSESWPIANLGCTNEQIKAITRHRTDAALAPYTRAADQQRLARQALAMQIKAGSELDQQPVRLGGRG